MKLLYLGLLIVKILSVVADSIISINDLVPEPNPVIEWSMGSEQDVTFARKLFELVVIRKLQLLHGRGDIPSLRLWAKNLVESEMVKSTTIISEIIYSLEEDHINLDLLPEGWRSLAREGKNLKRLADNLEKNDNFTTWEILNVAWAAFDYWAIVQEIGLPNNPEEWWNSGPMELVEQVRAKRNLVENFPGLSILAKYYSSICTSYESKITASPHGESISESEIRDLSHKQSIYTVLRFVWNYCPKVLESILTSVNRYIILKDEGKFARQNGVPYLSDSTGNVHLLLSPNGYALPYDLNSQSGKDRLEYHLNIQASGIDQSKSGESNNLPLFPEQERLFWILTNVFSALKSIKWTNGDIELGYINGLEKINEYEIVKELWSAFAYNSIGQIHPELDILNSCLYSDNFSQLQLFIDLLHEHPTSTDLKIPPLYTILTPEYSQNTISENKMAGEGISMQEKREAKYEDLYATRPDSMQPSNQISEVLDTGSPFRRVLRSKDEDEDEDNYYTDNVSQSPRMSSDVSKETSSRSSISPKDISPRSSTPISPKDISPRSSTPISPKDISPRSSTSPRNISPRSSTPISPKDISPRNSTSPRNISPRSSTSISPKDISPRNSTSPRNISPRSSTPISPKDISPRSSTPISPKDISPRSSTPISPKDISPRSSTPISPKDISPRNSTSPRNISPSPRSSTPISPKDISPRSSTPISPKDISPRNSTSPRNISPSPRSSTPISPKDISPRSSTSISPKDISPRSSTPISPKDISPRNSTSPRNISPSPRSSTPISPKDISPRSFTSPRNISPRSSTPISPKDISPRNSTSPRNISPRSSTPISFKDISPRSSTSFRNISPRSSTPISPKDISPRSSTPISPKDISPRSSTPISPKDISARSSTSPRNISPRSSTPISPKDISARSSTSSRNISPRSSTPISPKDISPRSSTSPRNISPRSSTPISPKDISPRNSTSPRNISPRSSIPTSPKDTSPRSSTPTSPKDTSPRSSTSPRNISPINPVPSECASITSPDSPECISITSPGFPRNNNPTDYNSSTKTFSPHSFRSSGDFNKSSKNFKNLKSIESKFKDLVSFEDIGENPKIFEFEASPKLQEESDIQASYFEVYSASNEVNSVDIPKYSHSVHNFSTTTTQTPTCHSTSPVKYPCNISIQDLSAQSPKVSKLTEQMTFSNLTSIDLTSSPVYITKGIPSSIQLPLLDIGKTHFPIKERPDLPEMEFQTTDSVLALVGSTETPVSPKTQKPTVSDSEITKFNIKGPVEVQSSTENTETKGLYSNSSRVVQDILNGITGIQSSIILKNLDILATSN
ncbi:hypothetical protein ACR3K2_05580 [Cryptosporidium serpentis]